MKRKKAQKESSSRQLTLEQAGEVLGVSGAQLLGLLEEAGLAVGGGPDVRIDAQDVQALRRQREKEQQRNEKVLNELASGFDEEEGQALGDRGEAEAGDR